MRGAVREMYEETGLEIHTAESRSCILRNLISQRFGMTDESCATVMDMRKVKSVKMHRKTQRKLKLYLLTEKK